MAVLITDEDRQAFVDKQIAEQKLTAALAEINTKYQGQVDALKVKWSAEIAAKQKEYA